MLVAAFSIGMIVYTSWIADSISVQRDNIRLNVKALECTNRFTQTIQDAQSDANLYAFSNNQLYKESYLRNKEYIGILSDSILLSSFNREQDSVTISEIISLLEQKETTSDELQVLFNQYNPWDALFKIIESYEPEAPTAVKVTATTVRDTIVRNTPRKNFWKRLSEAFYPEPSVDSTIYVTKTQIDTIRIEQHEPSDIFRDIRTYSTAASSDYKSNIKQIEAKLYSLISYDHEISREIESLLIRLHESNLSTSLAEIEKSEELIRRNTTNTTITCCISLALVLLLIFMIVNDINNGYRARKELEKAKQRTEELMESRHKMLLSVSHDIKAPLSSIIGHIELLKDENNTGEAGHLNSMQSSAEHIMGLLSNLLDFSSLEQGKLTVNNSRLNVSELCNNLVSMFEIVAKQKQLAFEHDFRIEPTLSVNSDETKIKQILTNIISNSIKYTIRGKVVFDVSFSDNKLIFTISDTGIGIPEKQIDEIFKPFARIDNNANVEGNGYGLYVVKGLVDMLGGTIGVDSTEGEGSTFIVSIPVETQSDNQSSSEPASIKQQNILIIDDDNSLLSVIEEMIQRIGHKATICRSLPEFEEQLKSVAGFDLVLTDREMGAVSGQDILDSIKECSPSTKVFLMTARTEYTTEEATGEGFDGFIHKPFSIKQFAALLNTNVENSASGSSRFGHNFPTLCSMLGGDDSAIIKVLQAFIESTSDNMVTLSEAIDGNDFQSAQAVCHKMLPMFTELDRKQAVVYLAKMDSLRGHHESEYPQWKDDSIDFMNQADEFLSKIEDLI